MIRHTSIIQRRVWIRPVTHRTTVTTMYACLTRFSRKLISSSSLRKIYQNPQIRLLVQLLILPDYPFSRQEKFYQITEKIFLETRQHISYFTTKPYKHYKQGRGEIFQKKCPHRFLNFSAGCTKSEKLLCHKWFDFTHHPEQSRKIAQCFASDLSPALQKNRFHVYCSLVKVK